jgi:hypothetical protein
MQKESDEQKRKIKKTERALKVAEVCNKFVLLLMHLCPGCCVVYILLHICSFAL